MPVQRLTHELDHFNGKGDRLYIAIVRYKKKIRAERALFVGRRWTWQVDLDGPFLSITCLRCRNAGFIFMPFMLDVHARVFQLRRDSTQQG